MLILGLYLFIALFFSFLCSIAEAVLLSVSWVYIALLEKKGKKSGQILRKLKQNINRPLAAILTLNTIAHTVGAAGVGAQATLVLENVSLGVVSAVLTFLILVFSEVIPKTLGASNWKILAPATAYGLRVLIYILNPLIKVLEFITQNMVKSESVGFKRDEFTIMAKLSAEEGHIDQQESVILQNLLLLQEINIKDEMTPRTVMFSVSLDLRVGEFFHIHKKNRFSRIPIYDGKQDNIVGFVIRADLLLAQARSNSDFLLSNYVRNMPTLLDNMSLSHALKEMMLAKAHISLIVNEYGTVKGILTLEDIIETLIGHEIIDEGDKDINMQKLAKRLWKTKAKKDGIELEEKKQN